MAKAKPVISGGRNHQEEHQLKVCQPRRPEQDRRFLEIGVEFREHGLHRAHDEGEANEGERNGNARPREGATFIPVNRDEVSFKLRRWDQATHSLPDVIVVSAMPATAVGKATGGRPGRRPPGVPGNVITNQNPGDHDGQTRRSPRRPRAKRQS